MSNKYILDFRNFILEKLNTQMYSLNYNVNYVENDFDYKDTFTADDGNSIQVNFMGNRYYITDVVGFYGKYDKDLSMTLTNADEEIHILWQGKFGRSKVNINGLGWVNINHLNPIEMHKTTLAQNIVDIIEYVESKYKQDDVIRDIPIGEDLNSEF